MIEYILAKIILIPACIFSFSAAAYGKAYISDRLGDPTPRNNGRLTLNPIAHLDIIGLICILLVGIGWSKPVPTNSSFYKRKTRDKALVALSGPIFLVLTGIAFSFISAIYDYTLSVWLSNSVVSIIGRILSGFVSLPIVLANFWLIPLPGLDGYEFVTCFTPYSWNEKLFKIERYSMLIFLGFIVIIDFIPLLSPLLREIVFAPSSLLISGLEFLTHSLFGLIF